MVWYTSFWLEKWLRGGTKASVLSVKKEICLFIGMKREERMMNTYYHCTYYNDLVRDSYSSFFISLRYLRSFFMIVLGKFCKLCLQVLHIYIYIWLKNFIGKKESEAIVPSNRFKRKKRKSVITMFRYKKFLVSEKIIWYHSLSTRPLYSWVFWVQVCNSRILEKARFAILAMLSLIRGSFLRPLGFLLVPWESFDFRSNGWY